MSPDHFRKQAQLRTATLCVVGYSLLAAITGILVMACMMNGRGLWTALISCAAALLLAAGFTRRARRLMLELEQENLAGRPWAEVKRDLAALHQQHRKN